ncbi:hypothetical protein Adt_27389 [Abeliophyllum distichum]|uniref:Uncharacterized protein n=1 Tax=Abeliophyllum distichum TaxID=126358 RepID=A0ABD1RUB5_9LAMI
MGENEPHPSAFEHLKGKTVMNGGVNLCARCYKEIGNVTESSYKQPIHPINASSFHPFGGQVRPFYEKQYGSFQSIRTFRSQPQRPNIWHSYNSKMGRVISFNEMTRTQQRYFQRNYKQMTRQQQYVECSKTTIKSKVVDQNALENGKEENTEASMEELSTDECIEKSMFQHERRMRTMTTLGN